MIPVVTMPRREGVESKPVEPPEVFEPTPPTGSDSRTEANTETNTDPNSTLSQAQLDAAQARATYRSSILDGNPLTDKALGAQYHRSRTWGAQRKDEVHASIADGLDPTSPPQQAPQPSEQGTESDSSARRDPQPGPKHGRDRAPQPDQLSVRDLVPATETPPPRQPSGVDAHGELEPDPSPVPVHARTDVPGARHAAGSAHVVVWIALLLGIGVSIGANVMSTQLVTDQGAAWIGAAFWPIALLLALEIITRVPWPRTALYTVARFLGIGLVAVVAAILSYRHMVTLLLSWGEDPGSAYLGPLAVDGLMLTAATALLALGRPRPKQSGTQPRQHAKHPAAYDEH